MESFVVVETRQGNGLLQKRSFNVWGPKPKRQTDNAGMIGKKKPPWAVQEGTILPTIWGKL